MSADPGWSASGGANGNQCRLQPASGLPTEFRSILVDVDATTDVQPVLERAVRIARMSGARLRIVDVVPPPAWAGIESARISEENISRRVVLTGLASGVQGVVVDWELLAGPAASALVDEVRRSHHDLLMRLHSRDLVSRPSQDSRQVDAQLFRMCPCPVWAAGYGAVPARPHVVAAVRVGSEDEYDDQRNTRIVDLAARIAHIENGSLTLLHAWTAFAERKVRAHISAEDFSTYIDEVHRRVAHQLATLVPLSRMAVRDVRLELRQGEPEHVIPEYVVRQGVDVVVVGAGVVRGIGGLVFGSTANRLLRLLPCSVVAVR